MKSPLFYYEPRVGFAYDIFGTGKTVLRSGFAVFHYQVSTQVADAATGPEGAFTFSRQHVYPYARDPTPADTTRSNRERSAFHSAVERRLRMEQQFTVCCRETTRLR